MKFKSFNDQIFKSFSSNFRLSDVEKRLLDLQANEQSLRVRVEELEEAEANLKRDLVKSGKESAEKERHWRQKVGQLEEELEAHRQSLTR